MIVSNGDSTSGVNAGSFGPWLAQTRAALRGEHGADVPCGDCVGCCVSAYFIPIRSRDAAARAAIPVKWLVRAPNQAPGDTMMGYLADGTCPMLAAKKCSIYPDRPQTCRDYDCRVFAAAGIEAGGAEKSTINQRVREWRFTYETEQARRDHEAVRATARFIRERDASFPHNRAPIAPTGIAVLALKSYGVYLDEAVRTLSNQEIAAAIVKASRDFDAQCASES